MSIETQERIIQTENELVNEVDQSEIFFPIPGPLSKGPDRYLLGPQTRFEISENGEDFTIHSIEEIKNTIPEDTIDSSRQVDKLRNEVSLDLTPDYLK